MAFIERGPPSFFGTTENRHLSRQLRWVNPSEAAKLAHHAAEGYIGASGEATCAFILGDNRRRFPLAHPPCAEQPQLGA